MTKARTWLSALVLAVIANVSAFAITFPSLTTIYVGAGVKYTDECCGDPPVTGTQTIFHCTNVSGITANVRIMLLDQAGAFLDDVTLTVVHGETITVATGLTAGYRETDFLTPPTGPTNLASGVINIESTQSAVFCNGKVADGGSESSRGITLTLVRVNPHPGTVE